ncbi:1-acyl-sn-glycerol-3-phosphate acyltransferase [Streptomyces sp. DH12]|uniref:lysophospholipid acyltransferase family protein n=1 Tax=Streptomyces sp. DH12 TaxID=2857010 RepID=UPI001E28B6C2|nr:lysophospholipid acyltransferase family protein [Streptomyces sp. DH12]
MSAWLPASPCTPRRCATPAHPAAGHPRAVLRLAAGAAAVLAGLVLAPLAAPLAPAARHRLARLWCRTVLRAFGVRARVTGTPPPGAHLVVANHVSWLDVPLLAAVLPGRMVAKREVRDWPLLGPIAALGGTLFLDRDCLRALPGAVRAIARALGAGHRVVVFPEGSTWCGRAGGAFRPAAFQAALDAGAPVQPVRIAYRPLGAAAFVGDDPLVVSLWRVVSAGALTAELRLLPPLPAGRHTDRRALARAAHAAVTGRAAAAAPGGTDIPPHPPHPPRTRNHRLAGVRTGSAAAAHTTVASDSANQPRSSVHHRDNSMPAASSSRATPS